MTHLATIRTEDDTLYRLRHRNRSTGTHSSGTGKRDLLIDRLGPDGWSQVESHRENMTPDAIEHGIHLIERMYFESVTDITFYPDVECYGLEDTLNSSVIDSDSTSIVLPETDLHQNGPVTSDANSAAD